MKFPHLALAVLVHTAPALANGPSELAQTDRAMWPDPINTADLFDRASRFEIAAFTAALAPLDAPNADLAALTGVKDPDAASVKAWHEKTTATLAANFKAASAACKADEPLCVELKDAASKIPDKYKPWFESAKTFYERYAREQLRLAGLFGRISSEILPLDPAELNGFEMPDKSFRLTFDDGPTAKGGHTDKLITLLGEKKLNGHFFVLGENFESRQKKSGDVKDLFKGQCLASHGFKHNSHAKLDTWRDSLSSTDALLRAAFAEQKPFHWRPPYGQRKKEAAGYLAKDLGGAKLMLWNIDSQDWHGKMTPDGMQGRVVSLMLVWRRGILLFHDVHDKVQKALPGVLQSLDGSGVKWLDCAKDAV